MQIVNYFYDYSLLLLPFYITVYYFLNVELRKRFYWDSFTRIISTLNAFQCCYLVYDQLINNPTYTILLQTTNIQATKQLLLFASYLIIDGLMQLPDLYTNFSANLILSIAHHGIGGYGIYMMGINRQGLGLGMYFAMTEVSTPLLNMSWILYKLNVHNSFSEIIFTSFYLSFIISRILTIPLLLMYLYMNYTDILLLPYNHKCLVFYGSASLIFLNMTWFIFLTLKFFNNKRNK